MSAYLTRLMHTNVGISFQPISSHKLLQIHVTRRLKNTRSHTTSSAVISSDKWSLWNSVGFVLSAVAKCPRQTVPALKPHCRQEIISAALFFLFLPSLILRPKKSNIPSRDTFPELHTDQMLSPTYSPNCICPQKEHLA